MGIDLNIFCIRHILRIPYISLHTTFEAKIEREQIVLNRSQPGLLRSTGSASPLTSLWEDPECRPEELENGLDYSVK